MDSCELRRVFLMFDRNGDGRITKNELSDSLQNMGMSISETDLSEMIEKIDVNGDGCVDIDEFGALYESILDREREAAAKGKKAAAAAATAATKEEGEGEGEGEEEEEEEEEEDMREAFNSFDQNRDGFITVDELRSVLSSLGLKQGRTAEDCRIIISRVDADGDGRVNFTEFKQMMKGGGFAALS